MVGDQQTREAFEAIRSATVAPDVSFIAGESHRRRVQGRLVAGVAVAAVAFAAIGSIALLADEGSQIATGGTDSEIAVAPGSEPAGPQDPPPAGPPADVVVQPGPCRNANVAVGANMAWTLAENLPLAWLGEESVEGTIVENPDGDLFFAAGDVQLRVYLPGETQAPDSCVGWDPPAQDTSNGESTLSPADEDAASIFVGLPLDDAAALAEADGAPWRVIRADGTDIAFRLDLLPGRLNFTVEDDIVVGVFVEQAPSATSEPDPEVGLRVTVGDRAREPGPGEIKLWVSNQSIETPTVGLTITIDDQAIADSFFDVDGQHTYEPYDITGLDPGTHRFTVETTTGISIEAEFEVRSDAPGWLSLSFWDAAENPEQLEFAESDEPLGSF